VLVSRSRDGELAAGTLARLGVGAVRGSSSLGGMAALREGARLLEKGVSVAVLADGPRGPRHQAARGAAALSSMSGRPIVCLRATPGHALRLSSWDHFEIPLPFVQILVQASVIEPIGRGREAIEQGRVAVELALSIQVDERRD
jgi:Kdo2-lipid IVA 3' secondary acyltransferase